MLAVEDTFDTEFPDEMLTRASFESIGAIASAVARLTGDAAA
jgi:acyl carrier protein